MRTTSSRDNWERLVAAVIKRDQIWQLCHQDSITTVDSDFSQRDLSLRSVPSSSSRLPLATDSVVQDIEVRKNGSGTITQKIFSALLGRKKHKDDYYDLGEEWVGIPEDHSGLKSFSLRELQLATDNFNNQNFLRRGGFGNVYKGRLADGSLVEVKRFREQAQVKIENELEILSTVKHRNVIGPLGFCITEKERLIVYPFMVNGSVASCLRERRESEPPLGWETRLQIALGVARALYYLHHGCTRGIIHRDVKAANILLDVEFQAFVAYFSLAKFVDSSDNVVRGTIGHIAPEYLSTGKCSLETDVYGYGMFLLELITAQRAFDLARLANDADVMLRDWVKTRFEEKKFEIIVDQDLEGNYVEEEVEKLFQIALICTQTDPEGRPTMSEIVRMLEYGDGFDEGWEKFKNVYQDENYSSKLHPSAEWIMTKDLGKELVGIPEDHFGLKSFSLRELQLATDNFYNKNILGRGGFGNVYTGRLADGSLMAVKRYKELAEVTIEEELNILSIVKHRNVIGPLGFCITEKEWLIVYPYMVNGSVASCLRERRESEPPLGWETRLRIALGVASALDYLHHGCIRGIVHRDVKATNILLDEYFRAVVSDFSLATFMDSFDILVRGTIGHMAPEFLSTCKCSLETDVYGYGIFLLELITAQRAFDLARLANDDDVMLLDWVKNLFEEKKFEIIVDPYLEGNYVDEEVEKLLQIALICTQTDPEGRPTMSIIVRMLEYGDRLDEVWKKFSQNFYQDENYYSSKLHPSADLSIDAEELSGPR